MVSAPQFQALMQAILGVLFHFIGGFASGSFYIPYKRVKGWSWESYWIVGGLFSWLIVPPLAAWLTIPDFPAIIAATDHATLAATYIFGLLWGIGGLTFGLGLRYLGVSLGTSIMLGLSSVIGALIPAVYYDYHTVAGKDRFSDLIRTAWGRVVLAGMLVCVLGIILCGRAGVMKERDLKRGSEPGSVPGKGFSFGLGLTVAIVSGVLSACFNFGLEAGNGMAVTAQELWKAANPGTGNFLYRNNVVYVVLLWGGLTTNFVWCMFLNARNKSFGDYTERKVPLLRNYMFSALAGITWFLQFFFYGMGESRLGNGPSSWILHMSFIILIANVWGLVLREWKGVRTATYRTVLLGVLLLFASIVIVGYGNSLHVPEAPANL